MNEIRVVGKLVMFRFSVLTVAGWVNQRHNHVIVYLLDLADARTREAVLALRVYALYGDEEAYREGEEERHATERA